MTAIEKPCSRAKDRDAALACADAILNKIRNNPTALNRFAWTLLTEEQYGNAYGELALRLSERSNKVTDFGNWMFLDTLALARFESGDAPGAVALERKAIERCDGCWGIDDMKKALARFETAVAQGTPTGGTTSR